LSRNRISKLQVESLRQKFRSDSGSAIVEFVALAIPLFIPIFIYLNQFSSLSGNEEIARAMAREVLRVYVISENDSDAQEHSKRAALLMAKQWNLSDIEIASLRSSLDCSSNPCLSADGRIKLTVTFVDDATGRNISASAQEHLSPWL
jgi:Flp pilus assembly protein TadG